MIDGITLYWLDGSNGAVERCALEDCSSPEIVALVQADATLAAQDAKSLYLIIGPVQAASIVRLAK